MERGKYAWVENKEIGQKNTMTIEQEDKSEALGFCKFIFFA